jgi:HK97 family phage major capsid protein
MPDYTDLSEANGWIPEPSSPDVLTRQTEASAVEAAARKVVMTSRTVAVPRFEADGVDVVPEHEVIPLFDADLSEVVLTATKFANRFAISIEDREDAVVDALNAAKGAWLSNFAVKLDNAVLGTVGAANGTTRPFTSVYEAVGAGNRTATAGALTYEALEAAFAGLDAGIYGGNNVVFAHPAFKSALRNLKDSDGLRVADGLLEAGAPSLFGANVIFTRGAVASTTASDRPTGNPLLIVANKQHLILGVRSGPESLVSEAPQWETDHVELKMRARRGFALATADAARVIELTAGA